MVCVHGSVVTLISVVRRPEKGASGGKVDFLSLSEEAWVVSRVLENRRTAYTLSQMYSSHHRLRCEARISSERSRLLHGRR